MHQKNDDPMLIDSTHQQQPLSGSDPRMNAAYHLLWFIVVHLNSNAMPRGLLQIATRSQKKKQDPYLLVVVVESSSFLFIIAVVGIEMMGHLVDLLGRAKRYQSYSHDGGWCVVLGANCECDRDNFHAGWLCTHPIQEPNHGFDVGFLDLVRTFFEHDQVQNPIGHPRLSSAAPSSPWRYGYTKTRSMVTLEVVLQSWLSKIHGDRACILYTFQSPTILLMVNL